MSESTGKMLGVKEEDAVASEPHTLRKEVDVAIIGNGPSGMCLSLLLSGHWPYFNGTHPNPYLTTKLKEYPNTSIVEQDLQCLSDGLEGRSNNPVALLMDTLLQPNADIGEHHPPSLRWDYLPSKQISHVVLGIGKPGGSWQRMQSDIMSLSLGNWLELPALRFEEWQEGRTQIRHKSDERVQLGDVADYYLDYVDKMGLEDNFLNGVEVTNVVNLERKRQRPCSSRSSSVSSCCTPDHEVLVSDISCDTTQLAASEEPIGSDVTHLSGCLGSTPDPSSREMSPCSSCLSDSEDNGVYCNGTKKSDCCAKYRWCVRGKQVDQDGVEENVIVCARNVVLACGVDCPRKLNIPGEDLPFVVQHFSSLDVVPNDPRPLLVVGAGLSAADTILLAMSKGIKVIHVFYHDVNNPELIYHKMPREIYVEYTHIFSLMQGKVRSDYYTPFSRHRVSEFKPGGVCVLQDEKGQCTTLEVFQAQVLIGSEAHLDFLTENIVRKLGIHPDLPIHAKKNPIDIDPFTFECENVPFLYAMGPLVGDNFVRFVLGGALGITQSLHQKNE